MDCSFPEKNQKGTPCGATSYVCPSKQTYAFCFFFPDTTVNQCSKDAFREAEQRFLLLFLEKEEYNPNNIGGL
jgi:hypothetical protein